MTAQEELFCQRYALPDDDGRRRTLAQAYRLAFGETSKGEAQSLLQRDDINERIGQLRSEADRALVERIASLGIAQKAQRMIRKNRDWERLKELIASRGLAFDCVPGGETGLLESYPRQMGGERVEAFRLDKGTLDALLDLEESAARELGQLGESMPTPAGQVVIVLPENGR
jgi:uncharacterized small protein (DUF1192 family)